MVRSTDGSRIGFADRMTFSAVCGGVGSVISRICICGSTVVAGCTILNLVCAVIETFFKFDGGYFSFADGVTEFTVGFFEVGMIGRHVSRVTGCTVGSFVGGMVNAALAVTLHTVIVGECRVISGEVFVDDDTGVAGVAVSEEPVGAVR